MNNVDQNQINELFDQSPKEVQDIILGDELDNIAIELGTKYKIHIDLLTHLKDTIILILVGATEPENALASFKEHLKLDDDTTLALVRDLNISLFQKVRIDLFGKELAKDEVKKITLGDNKNTTKDALREQITNKTRREALINKTPSERIDPLKRGRVIGSRAQLMEQLEVLEAIPTNEDVEERLNKIKSKISSVNNLIEDNSKEEDEVMKVKSEAKELFAEKGDTLIKPESKTATYSKAPTNYNVDPYRETAEE